MRYTYIAVAVLVGIVLIHLTYIPNGFVWLDHGDIELKRAIVTDAPWLAFVSRFAQTGFYRPMVTLIHSFDYYLYSEWAPGYHVTNILLHMAVAALTPSFLSLFIPLQKHDRIISMLVVGLHPVAWLPVGAISYRPEIMYTLGVMCTVLMYVRMRTAPDLRYFLGFSFAVFAAFCSKETALVLTPLLIGAWKFSMRKENHRLRHMAHRKHSIHPAAVLLAIYGCYGLLRWYAVPEIWRVSAPPLSFVDAVGTRIQVLELQILRLLLPLRTPLSDATPIISFLSPAPLLGIAGLIFYGWLVLYKKISPAWNTFCMLLTITVLPAMQIVPAPRFSSAHYAYFSIVIIALVPILLLRSFPKKIVFHRPLLIALSCWILVAAYTTSLSGSRIKNDRTFFTPEVARDDAFREGHQYLGDFYFISASENDIQSLEKAAYHYEHALRENPRVIAFADSSSVLNNLAGVYIAQNKLLEAEKLLKKLWTQKPSPTVVYHRALVAYKLEKYEEALQLLSEASPDGHHPASRLLQAEILKKLAASSSE